MRKVVSSAMVTLVTLCFPAAAAEKFALSKEERQRAFDKLLSLNDFYADVSTSTSCRHPRSPGERLICLNGDLQLMELVHARGAAYAEENASKQVVNHKLFNSSLPASCKTEACVAGFFRKAADDELGGESPYLADGQSSK